MAKFNLNSDRAKELHESAEKGFTLLPQGKHQMRCTDVVFRIATNASGESKEAWDLSLEVVKGEPSEHLTCRDTLFFTEKAMGRLRLVMLAFGVKERDLDNVDPEQQSSRNLIVGRTAIVEVEHKIDSKGRTWANPTFAGYEIAHAGAIKEHRENVAAGASGGGGVKSPVDDGGDFDIPF